MDPQVDYSGRPRAGLTANCRRDSNAYAVGLGDVAFVPGSDGARFVSRYRAWLGLGELPQGPSIQGAARGRRHKPSGDDITIGEPALLIVLACKPNALRCRVHGTAREFTLRTAVRDEVPGAAVVLRLGWRCETAYRGQRRIGSWPRDAGVVPWPIEECPAI